MVVMMLRKRSKWENDDYVCRILILNRMYDTLFEIYQYLEYAKELWNSWKLMRAARLCKAVVGSGMESEFLSQKGSGGGRGVKEKNLNRNSMNTSSGISVSMKSDDTMNEDTPVVVASTVKEGVTPSVVDMMMEKEKISSLDDTSVSEYFPILTTPDTTTAGNASGKSTERFANTAYGFFLGKKVAYPVIANYVRNTWGKYGFVHSMFNSSTRLFFFQFSSMDGLDAMLENGQWFIRNNPLILKKWHLDENLLKENVSTVSVWVKLQGVPVTAFSEDGLSAIATKLVMIELRADVELKDNIVVAMPKITREGHYTCASEKKTVKKPSQTSRGVSVGPKVGFKPHKEYRHVSKKSTASSSGNKKKGEEPTIEVSNSNPFDVLNSIDNDVEFGTNRGTTNLVNNRATSSGFSFMNVDISSSGTTSIIEKIGKFEDLITSGQAILVDKDVNPLKNVEFPSEYDSEDKVASVDNDMTHSMTYERVFGTQSLLENERIRM
ncbi:probable leucine-rich repeat receptor-like protein kinase, partial [Tanacetum coccineum]